MYEHNLITDQESEAKEPPKNAEQPEQPKEADMNSMQAEEPDDPSPFVAYGEPVGQIAASIAE